MKYKKLVGECTYKEKLYNQSFNQCSFSKNYHVTVFGNDVKQMEPLRDTTD